MWLPSRVEQRHKGRALLLWGILFSALLAYTAWEVRTALRSRDNPSMNISVQESVYQYPDLTVCLLPGYACDGDSAEWCASSALENGVIHHAFAINGFVPEGPQNVSAVIDEHVPNCLIFKLSSLMVDPDLYSDGVMVVPEVFVLLQWTASLDNTVELDTVRESVLIVLSDADEENSMVNPQTSVPYNRINGTNVKTNLVATAFNMGLTETVKLSGEVERRYSGLSMSHLEWDLSEEAGKTSYYENGIDGAFFLHLFQPRQSYITYEEVDPVQWSTILGTIGGAWELLLIVWGVFFIARVRDEPDLKGRNFFKSTVRGKEAATAMSLKLVPARLKSVDASTTSATERGMGQSVTESGREELPSWQRGAGGAPSRKEDGVVIRLFEHHGLIAFVNASQIKTFLQREYDAKSLRYGARHPLLKRLLPSNTWVAVIPTGSSMTAAARSVSEYCRAGGDAARPNGGLVSTTTSNGGITVKVKRARCSVLQSEALAASGYLAQNDCTDEDSDVDVYSANSNGAASAGVVPGGQRHWTPAQLTRLPSYRTAAAAGGGLNSSKSSRSSNQGEATDTNAARGRKPQPISLPRPADRPFKAALAAPARDV